MIDARVSLYDVRYYRHIVTRNYFWYDFPSVFILFSWNVIHVKALIQRVLEAQVSVDKQIVGRIGPGLVILLGITKTDGTADADRLAERVLSYRISDDDEGRMYRSISESVAIFPIDPIKRGRWGMRRLPCAVRQALQSIDTVGPINL